MLTQAIINQKLDTLKDQYVMQKSMKIGTIIEQLNKLFWNHWLQFVPKQNENIIHGDTGVAGDFNPHSKLIRIYISHSKRIMLSPYIAFGSEEAFDRFKFYISMTLQHELRHRYQWKERVEYIPSGIVKCKLPDNKLASYYAQYDEIDCYAHDAALEMSFLNKSHTKDDYREIFGNDHEVYKRFLKKLYLNQHVRNVAYIP